MARHYTPPGDGPSEFSWGPGNVPPGCEQLPPSEGGAYSGKTPPATDGGLSATAQELAERQGNRP